MSRVPWASYLWPGLPQIWRDGAWSGLALAVGFAGLLNLALAASLLWCELLGPSLRTMVWAAVMATWGGSLLASTRSNLARRPDKQDLTKPDAIFREAVDEYLKGNWFEAERALAELLDRSPRDADARLMLATLLRHAGRLDEAAEHLDRLERMEQSSKWRWEIRRERERLDELRAQRRLAHGEQECTSDSLTAPER